LGLYYSRPPRHGGSGFDASLCGGSGFDVDLGDAIGYNDCVRDHGFGFLPTQHGRGGHAFDEQGFCFDGNLGDNYPLTRHGPGGSGFVAAWRGRSGLDTHFGGGSGNDRGSDYLSTWHRRGGSGFAPAWRGRSGLEAHFGCGSGFDGHADDPRIHYPAYTCGGGDFDVPWRDPCSRPSGRFPLLDTAGVPLDAGEVHSTRRWPRIPLDAGKDLSARRWPHIPLDTGDDLTTFLRPDDTDDDLGSTPNRLGPRIPLDASEDLFARRRTRIPLDTGDDLTTFLRQDTTDEVFSTHHRLRPSTPRDAGPDHSTRREPHFELDAGDDLTTFLRPYATDEDLSTQDGRTPVDVASPTQDDPAPPDGGPYPCFSQGGHCYLVQKF
jgi:hypothetical protein